MSYNDCKQALFNSSIIGDIPDNWYRDIPVLFVSDGIMYVGFLFWKSTNESITLKRMIAINAINNEIKVYSPEQISEIFGINYLAVEALTIEDHKQFLSDENKYEQMVERIVDNTTNDYLQLSTIAKQLYSEEQYKTIIQKIGSTVYF